MSEGKNLAGDGSDSVTFERTKAPSRSAPAGPIDTDALMLMGATVRSVQSAGALEAILSLSVAYANERVAFERHDRKIPGRAAESRAAGRRDRRRARGRRFRRRHHRAQQMPSTTR